MYSVCKKSPDLDPHQTFPYLPQINLKKIQKNL